MAHEEILHYQQNPTKEGEAKLLAQYANYITPNINKWSGILPDQVLHAYGTKYAVDAFKSYDPSKAHINTHLWNHISQLSRHVYKHQNAVRIPEHQLQMVGKVNQAKSLLSDEFGREPSLDEIADHMHLPVKHIARVLKNQRADFLNDSDSEMQYAHGEVDHAAQERIFSYRQQLDETSKRQFDKITGYGGVKPLTPQQFGKEFKLKPYQVSRIKAAFAKGLK